VELGLESVTAVVFHGAESVEVVFVCPHCGTSLRAMLPTPNVLAAAAMEVVRQMNEVDAEAEDASIAEHDAPQLRGEHEEAVRREREQAGEPYCEYFRRQLAHIECVEDFLAETE
jgi:hypothetical protein